MPRPMKWRNVCSLPRINQFGPLSNNVDENSFITMTVEEMKLFVLLIRKLNKKIALNK